MPQVTVIVNGVATNYTGATAKALLAVLDCAQLINSKAASGVIQIHVGGANEDVKTKFDVTPNQN